MRYDLKNKKILVIGGAGFIGGFVVSELLTHDVKEVVIYDYVDYQIPMLARMAEKKMRGYTKLGYVLSNTVSDLSVQT